AETRIVAVAELDDAGDANEVDASPEAEAADDRRAGQDQDVQLLVLPDQGVGDGAATAEMPEPEGVMAVDEDAAPGARRRGPRAATVAARPTARSWRPHPACPPCPPGSGSSAGLPPGRCLRQLPGRGPLGVVGS